MSGLYLPAARSILMRTAVRSLDVPALHRVWSAVLGRADRHGVARFHHGEMGNLTGLGADELTDVLADLVARGVLYEGADARLQEVVLHAHESPDEPEPEAGSRQWVEQWAKTFTDNEGGSSQ